ncbi:formin-binding protein 1-like isoform X4 [Pantherophis guttatus]|uniref:Formin-binding protein 1-like n=2 Tax=Colubroidea TaxID=34989 RepID=A0A6P9DBM2_PANGU|nr:formin-binding protein 1-like isoform X1 [Pseudonaja textilis]XP_034293202.1 formin-binding protein 1-like isoform X4 [Pantherophis guttatus]XP_058031502.1 formin-binding protein 1-like isoform X1 [Ahaetulla prasina]
MSWGTELWDQFDNLDKHTQWGIDFLERYAKFVKERIEIEQNYAKQLRNLVKKYCPKRSSKDEEPRFTSCIAFYNILNELNDYAGQREVVAEELGHRVYGELMRYSHELKTERKLHLQEGRKAQQYLDMCWKQMDNSKKKFERECKEAEKAQQCYERLDNDTNATKADVEKAKQQLNLRTHMADENKNEYAAQLQNFNGEQHKHFYIVIPQIYKHLQEMDERRTIKLSECYKGFADSERKVIPIVSKCLEGMIAAAKSVDDRRDSQIVIDSFKSGFEPPGDFPFEDYSQHIYRTVSDGTISTPKQEGMKIDAKTTVGKAKGKLWLFGKKPKGPSQEDFSHLPPEQRRKKLQQRIDELNRELQKENDQKDALIKMKDVYEKNPQMGDPGSLQPKLMETMNNMDRLRMEIHKNEAWLSEVEGKVATRGDRRHSSDINHLVTQGRESPEGSYTDDANQEVRSPPQQHGPHNEFDDEFEDDDPLPAIGHCKAIYPFDGHNEGTLAMKEGEVLYIIEEDKGDGWTRARRQNGEEGYVPTTYIDVTLEKNSKGAVTYI